MCRTRGGRRRARCGSTSSARTISWKPRAISGCRAACSSPARRRSTAQRIGRSPRTIRSARANPYGVSKLAQEMIAAAASVSGAGCVRPFNHAGPRQSPSYATSAFAQQIADIEAGRREPVLRVGNLDAQRDITDVRDTVRAYEALVASAGIRAVPTTSAAAARYSMRALLDILLSFARVRVRVEVDPARLRPSDNPVILGSHDAPHRGHRLDAGNSHRADARGSARLLAPRSRMTRLRAFGASARQARERATASAAAAATATALRNRAAARSHGDGRLRVAAAVDVRGGRRSRSRWRRSASTSSCCRGCGRISIAPAIASAASTASSAIRSPFCCCCSRFRAGPTSPPPRGASSRSATASRRWRDAPSAGRDGRGTARRR